MDIKVIELDNKPKTSKKIKDLQEQYNKVLIDLFHKHAKDSIEDAIDGCKSDFGGNIQYIINVALDSIRTKVLEDLGVELPNASCPSCSDPYPLELPNLQDAIADFDGIGSPESEEI